MRPDRPGWHTVVADAPALLDALAAPFGTYVGVASCRPIPGTRSVEALSVDLLCALGKTQALTQKAGTGMAVAERWLRAHELARLFVVGADGVRAEVWRDLCFLGDRIGFDVVFVTAQPERWAAELAEVVHPGVDTVLALDLERLELMAPVGTPLPDVGFPALPAACAALLEPEHAARAQAIYDECLVAAFDALVVDRLLERGDAEHAFRCALGRAPDLAAVALAIHAVRAAGILRGYHIGFEESHGGVALDDLLTGDRLGQLGRLLSPEQAAAGVMAGMSGSWASVDIAEDGGRVDVAGVGHVVPTAARALMRAWAQTRSKPLQAPAGRPPRPPDARAGVLRRTPPPERLIVDCQPIDCRSFRRTADPPMGWTRPPSNHRRRGPARSPAPG
jgi:hypothetical protein